MTVRALLSAAAGAAGAEKLYVDDVFSAYTRTGTGADVTVTTGIDMTKGYMLWSKSRSGSTDHAIYHSARGVTLDLISNSTAAQTTQATGLKSVSATGHTVGSLAKMNTSSATYVDWVFRNADKFYNHAVVTKTAGSNATVSFSNLGELGIVRVKRIDAIGSWYIWHRGLSAGKLLIGETTAAAATLGHVTVSETTITLVNGVIADGTYLIEAFAHDTSADGIIQCGSYTGNGSATGPTINLGWEPQFVLVKRSSSGAGNWQMQDIMRGMSGTTSDVSLAANSTNSEDDFSSFARLTPRATGFQIVNSGADYNVNGITYIYLAIRRSNKPPTTGTQVYNAIARAGTGAAPVAVTGVGFSPDLVSIYTRDVGQDVTWLDRLRGKAPQLYTSSNITESVGYSGLSSFDMDGVTVFDAAGAVDMNQLGFNYINHFFRRATGVHDQICYNGSGANKTEAFTTLGVPAELWLVKRRNSASSWVFGSSLLNNTEKIVMPSPGGRVTDATAWNSTYPTATALSLGTLADVNASGGTYTAYLWASLAGVSKVLTYTGNGSTQTINCGFTTGARFVMIIRCTASTEQDVFVWDSARGIVAGNDPRMSLNSSANEVTTLDSEDADTSGFIVNQDASNINVSGAVYIALAYA